jgi:D-galactarolactone cycloisomerase
LKVTEIHGYHLAYSPRVPLGNARTFIRKREFLALEVRTDTGLLGWGEVFSSPWAAAAIIRRDFAGLIQGRSPLDHGAIHAELIARLGYDKRGPSRMAISALDMALHDLAARALGVSIAQFLGGTVRREVPCYASGPFIREGAEPYGAYPQEIEALLERGFKAVKPRAGITPRADAEMALAVRELIGNDADFMVDINQGYTPSAARLAARLMEPARPLWIEEPVAPESLEGYRATADATACAIAGGEAIGSPAGFDAFLGAGAVAILQPDLGVCGGYTGYRKATALAEARDVAVMPHAFGTVINFYASLQMAAAQPVRRGGAWADFPFVEYDVTGNPLIDLCGVPVGANGTAALPDGPGLGVELLPKQLEPWVVDHWEV